MKRLTLAAFAFSGAAALIYEIAWTRSLSILIGSTTYALSLLLGTFMGGLALGAWIGGKLADRQKNLLLVFGLIELSIGVFGLFSVPVIHALPPVYFAIHKALHLNPSAYFAAQILLSASVMLVPTTLMGATFPVVSKYITTCYEEMGQGVGSAYSYNTFGAIIGSIGAGFILIPSMGVKASAITAAFLNLAVAALMIIRSRSLIKNSIMTALFLLFTGSLALAALSSEEPLFPTFFHAGRYESYDTYLKSIKDAEILFDKEYIEGRVKLYREPSGFNILVTGGKLEGSSAQDMVTTHLLSWLPIASHPAPESFLNIGLGTGITLLAAKMHLADVSLVELNQGVIDAIRMHGPPKLLDGVDSKANDGRNYLLMTGRKFDIIASGPSYPIQSSAGNLFTREFYQLAATRLNKGGIYCQWLPYYIMSNNDVTMMIKTFGSVFKHIYIWKVATGSLELLMLGSNEPFVYSPEEIVSRVERLNTTRIPLPYTLSRTPAEVKQIIASNENIPLNTDDYPLLEFHAAKNLLTGVIE